MTGAINPNDYVPPPSLTLPTLDAACDAIGKGNVLTGAFVDFAQKQFMVEENILYSELRRCVWTPEDDSKILIAPATSWLPKKTMQRPGVLFRRNKFETQRVSINHQRQSPNATPTGDPHYSIVWGGTFTIFCLSGQPLQAEILGTEIAKKFLGFHEVLQRDLHLLRLDVVDIDGIGILEEHKQTFVVPVNLFVAFSESWFVHKQAPPLRKISMRALLQEE